MTIGNDSYKVVEGNSMGQYTIRIDNKDPIYKKLIKLPTAYYKLIKYNNNNYIIDSHIGTIAVGDINDVKLQKRDNEIVLYKGSSALNLQNGEIVVIEQEAIIGENKDDIVTELISGEEIFISHSYIKDSPNSGVGLLFYRPGQDPLRGVLNFINFNDENDPVLKGIKEETGGLYFTIKDDDTDQSRTVYISDKIGNPLPEYNYYQYQYKPSVADFETIDSIQAEHAKQKFTLQKGEKLSEGIYEANITLDDKVIATLPKIGYYILNDELIIHNHVTKERVAIPSDFHYLKVVKFGDNDYKLTFCNVLGNEFFEYKKYDPQYSNISEEYKFISLSCTKKEYNPSLGELLSHRPSFFIAEGSFEQGSDKHVANVFELTPVGKGRKMATLIDEFGYFNQDGMFMHCNYHKGSEYQNYDPAEIDKEYRITDADSEFYLTKHDNVTLHTIPQELF